MGTLLNSSSKAGIHLYNNNNKKIIHIYSIKNENLKSTKSCYTNGKKFKGIAL